MTPEALAIAERRAAEDRSLLARLVRAGRVRRGDPPAGLTAEAESLAADVRRLNDPHRGVNLAIKPKKKSRRGRR